MTRRSRFLACKAGRGQFRYYVGVGLAHNRDATNIDVTARLIVATADAQRSGCINRRAAPKRLVQ